ncbi:hypothetical protein G7046_g3191 [Stylonectria norvegica]|nr:hypothetical protein G7046_g3191 [Stylonectria norvegica]
MAPYLPPEVQLSILKFLMKPGDNSQGPRRHLPVYACVCKDWQVIVEKDTFRRLVLRPSEIRVFADCTRSLRRRSHIKHIVLEIPLEDDEDRRPRDAGRNHGENNMSLTTAAVHLWTVISRWRNHSLTVELGIISSYETRMEHTYYDDFRIPYRRLPRRTSFQTALVNPHMEYLQGFQDPPLHPLVLDAWIWLKRWLLGTKPLEFDINELSDTEHLSDTEQQDACLLPEVEVINCLLIRRQYFQNISPFTLSELIKSASGLEVFHLERWCYGRRRDDDYWDMDSAVLGHNLPLSLKRFTFYEEFSTDYHRRPGEMRLPRSNEVLLDTMFATSRHLEHISISFALDAQDFFSPRRQVEWGSLKTLALTSDVLVSHSSGLVNELLECAAKAAKKMPKLEILEIWYYNNVCQEVGIFRCERSGRSSTIIWYGTWSFQMLKHVEQAWHEICDDPEKGGLYEFGLKSISLPPQKIASLGSISPYLKLKKHILHDISWIIV